MATETVGSNESGSEPLGAIAQLERQLKLLEAAFAEGVERHEKFSREKASALSSVEQNVLALCNRMERAEHEQAGAMMELRSTLCDIGERLNGLEAGNQAGSVYKELSTDPPPVREAVPFDIGHDDIPTLEPHMVQESADTPVITADTPPPVAETYLDVARRAANEAAMPQKDEAAAQRPNFGRRSSRARLLLLGAAAPLVIVAVTIVALNRHIVTAAPELSLAVAPASAGFVLPAPPEVVVAPPADPSTAQLGSTSPVEELKQKAETGDAQAEREVGLKYLVGDGTNVDEAEAASWLLQASYKGDPTAEYWLGTLYAGGRGVPEDVSQANHWYEAAAKEGNRRAMHSLGVANFEGRGVEKNPEEAARWFTKAAELGFTDSQFNLAVLYEHGTGVAVSRVQAYKWYAIAAGHGDQKSNARVAELAKVLKPAELDAARSEAAAFKPVPMDASANAADGPAPSGG